MFNNLMPKPMDKVAMQPQIDAADDKAVATKSKYQVNVYLEGDFFDSLLPKLKEIFGSYSAGIRYILRNSDVAIKLVTENKIELKQ